MTREADEAVLVRPDIRRALDRGQPAVALESALVTHGLPRPWNVRAARAAEAAVRGRGALPATVAVHRQRVIVGLSADEIEQLAYAERAAKVSRHNLAAAVLGGGWGGTTVSATLVASALAGIRVLATGGIGGVHRGAGTNFDISSDLPELARTPLAVVCSGPKSMLDVPATLEYLETLGVPVVGIGTDELPGFLTRKSGRRVPLSVDTPRQAAELARRHWELKLGSSVLFVVPPPADTALSRDEADGAIRVALAEAAEQGTHGAAATPWVLARVAELTGGRAVRANVALVEHNASVAAQIAIALAEGTGA
ncbi:MAG: pseudouridine-5'-phosphate glycosidase [Actinomycetota bacterium]|nr:pseudouridine-5'-phosphate glycosidase [Actinomycetota bacterium]